MSEVSRRRPKESSWRPSEIIGDRIEMCSWIFGRIGRFSGRMPVLLHTGGTQAGDTKTIDGALPSEKFLIVSVYRRQASSMLSSPTRTATTTSALRRMTQRFVLGGGRSASSMPFLSRPERDTKSADFSCQITLADQLLKNPYCFGEVRSFGEYGPERDEFGLQRGSLGPELW